MKRKCIKKLLLKNLAACLAAVGIIGGFVSADVAERGIVMAAPAGFISEGKAKSVALKDAGYNEKAVEALYADDTRYKTRKAFKVSFYKKKGDLKYQKYEYIIWARNGQILERKKKDVKIVSKSYALRVALDKKDFRRKDVYDVDNYLGDDDEHLVYNIYYTSKGSADTKGSRDFEFTINAENGKILEWDVDDDD